MDIVTHALASLALVRGFFPRAGKMVIASAVFAGCFADVDWLATRFGPAATLSWRRTYFHSIFAAVVLTLLLLAVFFAFASLRTRKDLSPPAVEVRISTWLLVPFCGALLHLAMDGCQSDGVMLLWPFSAKRFAMDWLPDIDPWILAILVLTFVVPELLHMVSSEIGAKSHKPRGRTGALVGLALVAIYIGARGTLHTRAVALMESRTFHGESARRASAFPEALSLTTWHGIAETESALNVIEMNPLSSDTFDADTSLRIFKPQASPALDAARSTRAAKEFLGVAQIPKASVEKTDVGYVVILRDMRYAAAGETPHEIAALIELDPDNKVTAQEIVWARELHN